MDNNYFATMIFILCVCIAWAIRSKYETFPLEKSFPENITNLKRIPIFNVFFFFEENEMDYFKMFIQHFVFTRQSFA